MSNPVIQIENLVKIYSNTLRGKKINALREVNLEIHPGIIFGLLGPNGAGKTTLIKILLGITKLTSGSVTVLGAKPEKYLIRKKLGYLPENHKFPEYLNGYQLMKFYGELYGLRGKDLERRIDESLQLVKMEKWRKTKLRNYSKGMLQRIGLAQALFHDPEIIILDEPTDGVDPIGRKEIREVLNSLKGRGKTIFLNSHLLSEVELISDRVGILNEGELVYEGSIEGLTTDKKSYEIITNVSLEELLTTKLSAYQIQSKGNNKYLLSPDKDEDLNNVIDIIRGSGITIESFGPVKSSLEEKFINLIDKVENE